MLDQSQSKRQTMYKNGKNFFELFSFASLLMASGWDYPLFSDIYQGCGVSRKRNNDHPFFVAYHAVMKQYSSVFVTFICSSEISGKTTELIGWG